MKINANAVDIQDLKASIDLVGLFESYGIEVKKSGSQYECRCPFHDDKTASLKITPEKGLWNCFGCDAGGSAIDFIMCMENVDVSEAKKILLNRVPGVVRASALPAPNKPEPVPTIYLPSQFDGLMKNIFEHAHRALLKPDCPGLSYLKSRYLDDSETLRTFGVSFIDGSFRDLIPQEAEVIASLKHLGLLNDKGNPSFYNCVVVPVWLAGGQLGEAFARGIADDRRLYLKGSHAGVFNGKAFNVYEDVIVCESIFDAMSFYSIGIKNVIATYGTNGWTSDHDVLLNEGKTEKLVFAFDNDKAGNAGVERLVKQLKGRKEDCLSCYRLKLPQLENVKDCNELVAYFYREGFDKEAIKLTLESLIRSASRIGKSTTRKSDLILLEQTEDDLRFTSSTVLTAGNCQLSYRLRGLFDNNATSLRLVVTADNGDASHTDRLDLYAAKNRSSFAFHASQKLGLPNIKIEDDLSKLIPKLETLLVETRSQEKLSGGCRIAPMSDDQKKAALSFLTAKDLLGRIAKDLTAFGYVGETRNKQLAYLIATSRRLTKPLSGIVRSESGAGKSYLMECVAELMPPEDVHYFSRLTSQSLYYMGRDTLKNKLLIVDERNGSEESEYPIRTLQTRRKLTLAVPMKNAKTGNIETQEIEILGPIAYMESTTSTEINPENENRSFELYLDESPEQTARVFAAQKKAHAVGDEERAVKRKKIVELHSNVQRCLEAVTVKIPFVDQLDFPQMWTRGRRDIDRLLSLVEASAFLHQKQRRQIAFGASSGEQCRTIEASPEDYAIAYELSKNCLRHAWADLPRSAESLLDKLKKYVAKEAKRQGLKLSEVQFKRRDIRAATRLPDHIIKRGMRILEDLEYVITRRSRNGGTHSYRLATLPPAVDVLEGLTTPQELKTRTLKK